MIPARLHPPLAILLASTLGASVIGCAAAPDAESPGPSAVRASLNDVTPREAEIELRLVNRSAQPVYIDRIEATLSGPDGAVARGASERVLTLLGRDAAAATLRLPLLTAGAPLASGPLDLTGSVRFGYSGLLQSRASATQPFRLRVAPEEPRGTGDPSEGDAGG